MKSKLIILGCGSSVGVPRIDGYWGNCNKKNKKNIRSRCSAVIIKGSNSILIDASPDIKTQLLSNKISNVNVGGNINFEQQIGSEADESTELEYIWRSKKYINDHTAIGFEAYGALGEIKDFSPMKNQEHIIGPAIYNEFMIADIKIESHLVWMFGLTDDSPDNTFRWQIEFPFE